MNLSFCSLASGSSGNCYLIKSRESAILIDAGISTKKIHAALEDTGTDRNQISGVFITHEHSDHVKGLKVLTKQNPGWDVYSSEETCRCLQELVHNEERICTLNANCVKEIGGMRIKAMNISHDAVQPVCYTVETEGSKLSILTDTGYVPEDVFSELVGSDLIVIEANHEVNMLKAGSYPYSLKRRILGESGHLSNEAAGEALAEVVSCDDRFRTILLAHLSRENNFPQLAFQTVANILEERRYYPGKHMRLEVLSREGLSGFTEL